MASMKWLVLVPLLLAIMVLSAPPTESALTCSTVTNDLTPCINYLMGGALSPSCCNGIRSLNAAAQTTPDRQTACRCLKDAANSFSGVNVDAAAGLPAKCGINIPYKISPSTDCDSVK